MTDFCKLNFSPFHFQLWLERSCKVDFNYNDTICKNINDPEWEDYQNNVQQQVEPRCYKIRNARILKHTFLAYDDK